MTKGIEVQILDHNLNNMSMFLAKLTQRGHKISTMADLLNLYHQEINEEPSSEIMKLPHTTIRRMNYIIIAIVGLSTKAVSQLRTHATRLTFLSTSTQYSSYEDRKNNWVIPNGLDTTSRLMMEAAYDGLEDLYTDLLHYGIDKDKAGYLLPQGLRKALVIAGNLDAWQYMLNIRLCRRNTEEVQDICKLIYNEVKKINHTFTIGMEPSCYKGKCKEGKFCCGKKITEEDLTNAIKEG